MVQHRTGEQDGTGGAHGSTRVSRRELLRGAGGVAAGGLLARAPLETAPVGEPASDGPPVLEGEVEIVLRVNGDERRVRVEPRTTLLSALRDRLEPALTGAKEVCGRGNCGACTVLLDGDPIYSCLTLAVRAVGHEITTVEGLARDGRPTPVQEAMVDHDGMMCGFCTSGFVMSLTACLEKNPAASLDEIRAACAGNLCRCGTYSQVFQAALDAGRRMRREAR